MDQIRINATPNTVVVSPSGTGIRINATPNMVVVEPTAPRIKIRLATGPQGPAGPPAEVYVQQTQPPTPQNVGAIWYQTDANGNIQAEHVWDGSAWLPTPTAIGISTIVPVAPITASGTSVVSVGVDAATDTTPGVVARMATAGDVATAQPGPAVDAAVLKSVLPTNTSDLNNDGDGVGGPFVDATDAANAAPIQSLIAGNNIDIVSVGRDFTISAIPVPQHQSDWQITDTANPGYIKNKPTNVSEFANDSGYITAADVGPNAPVQSVNGMTGAVVIDLSPYATNADLALTNAKFADYLPLIGGTISGGLTVSGAFNVGPAGTARVPTVATTDASTAVATTEWVQSLLAATGAIRFMWKYGGDTVNVDPGLGNLDINIGNTIIAISKTDGHGNQRYLDPIATGDTIVLTDDPATGPATEYQRFDVIGTPTDNGNWVSIPVSLAGGTSPTRVVGEPMRVTIGLDSQVATIEGVSAGYGLTGGGVSGVVTLAADLTVMAQLADIPTVVSAFTNDAGYTNATEAAAAAPIQEIVSGTDISIVANPGKSFTINAIVPPQHQSDWAETNTGVPAYIKNKPTNVSEFVNDSGYITLGQVPPDAVASVNGKTGVVVLNAADVGALPGNTAIPSKTSDLTNDGSATSGPFVDATGAANAAPVQNIVAGQNITVSESSGVFTINSAGGGGAVDSVNGQTGVVVLTTSDLSNDSGYITLADIPTAPVQSVNGQTGVVVLNAADVSALPANTAIPANTSDLNNDGDGVGGPFVDALGAAAAAPVQNIVAGQNVTVSESSGVFTINAVGGGGAVDSVNGQTGIVVLATSDLTNDSGYITSAAIPTNVSAFTNDAGYITAAGAPVQSVNTQTGAVVLATSDLTNDSGYITSAAIPTNVSAFTNDAGYITSASIPANTSDLNNDGDGSGGGPFVDYAALSLELGDYLKLTGGTMSAGADIGFSDGASIGCSAANTFAIATSGTTRAQINGAGQLNVFGNAVVDGFHRTGGAVSAHSYANYNAGGSTWYGHLITPPAANELNATGTYAALRTALFPSGAATATAYGLQVVVNAEAGKTRHSIYCSGTAPSYLGNSQFAAGSAAAPALSFLADTNTGIFSGGPDILAFSTKGVNRFYIDDAGQLIAPAPYSPGTAQALATKEYVDSANVDFTNVPNGSNTAPSIAFEFDKTTGIYRDTTSLSWCVSVGGLKRFEIDPVGDAYFSGWVGVSVPDDATAPLDVNGNAIRIRETGNPVWANATGSPGEIRWSNGYIYVCVATNTWKRAALSTWTGEDNT